MAGHRKSINTKWSSDLSYVVGVIATDGCVGKKRAYMNITSKDRTLVESCRKVLGLENRIGMKGRGNSKIKRYYVLQWRHVVFYNFLLKIGILPAKSKILKRILVPDKYFADFLRGCIDGDGSIGSYSHPESKSLQLRIRLYSASLLFLLWIKEKIQTVAGIQNGWIYSESKYMHILSFGKTDSIKLGDFMYYPSAGLFLERKYEKIKPFIRASGEIG